MKSFVQISAFLLALSVTPSVLAQEITQAQKDGSAGLVTRCIAAKAPANSVMTITAVDRSNPAQFVLYNTARMADSNQLVDIDVKACDSTKQVADLLQFDAIIPASQKNWKILYLVNNSNNQYRVFTDLGLTKSAKK